MPEGQIVQGVVHPSEGDDAGDDGHADQGAPPQLRGPQLLDEKGAGLHERHSGQ